MLENATAGAIVELTKNYWDREVQTESFRRLATGKEIGHRIADLVDEKTTFLLQSQFDTLQEQGARGDRARSMGDIWLLSGGIYNPINIKAGEIGKNGQPNLVSLRKLLNALLKRQVDSYYLLIVKMTVGTSPDVAVYLVDLLGYLEYATFDSGPGQMMLKERAFYEAMANSCPPSSISMADKIGKLVAMLEDADRRLFANRQKAYAKMRASLDAYGSADGHLVDQSGLRLG